MKLEERIAYVALGAGTGNATVSLFSEPFAGGSWAVVILFALWCCVMIHGLVYPTDRRVDK